MPWFNVDDGLTFHRKVIKAGNSAMGLWVRAGAHCAQQLTDGFVATEIAHIIGTPKQAERLVLAGLWTVVEGGYQFHEYSADGRNPTRAEVLAKRSRNAERKSKQRARNLPDSEDAQVDEGGRTGTHNGVAGGVTGVVSDPPPLPSTKEEQKKTSSSSVPRKRGSRIPDDFTVTPEMVEWARENAPDVEGRQATAAFVDYWRGKTGRDATKLDWVATWRNWLRRDQERAERSRPRAAPNGMHPTDANIAVLLNGGSHLRALPGGSA
jgi:hypothetical protein